MNKFLCDDGMGPSVYECRFTAGASAGRFPCVPPQGRAAGFSRFKSPRILGYCGVSATFEVQGQGRLFRWRRHYRLSRRD